MTAKGSCAVLRGGGDGNTASLPDTITRDKTPHTRTGYRLHLTPSKEAVKAIRARLHDEWRQMNGRPVGAVITRLTPLIRGGATDVRSTKATATFTALDHCLTASLPHCITASLHHCMYRTQRHWATRQHATRTNGWLTRRYGDA